MTGIIRRSIRRARGADKGSRFERQTCEKLSLWLSVGKDTDLFWRSTSSGARATRRGDTSLIHAAGDISAVKRDGELFLRHFFVECKHYKDLQLHLFMTNQSGNLGKFWQVAQAQAACYRGRRPLLIAKQDRLPPLILMEPRSWRDFGLAYDGSWSLGNERVVVGLFGEFLSNAQIDFVPTRVRLPLERQG
jgi:hypothetical protein